MMAMPSASIYLKSGHVFLVFCEIRGGLVSILMKAGDSSKEPEPMSSLNSELNDVDTDS